MNDSQTKVVDINKIDRGKPPPGKVWFGEGETSAFTVLRTTKNSEPQLSQTRS
jgi:hypothetical protein